MADNPAGPLMSAAMLSKRLDDPDCVIVDCRFSLLDPRAGARAYAGSHIPGAVHADLDSDLAASSAGPGGRHPLPHPRDLAERLGGWGITDSTTVVAYDDAGGAIAARLWWLLQWLGHEQAFLLDGGLAAWQEAGLALNDRPVQPVALRYEGSSGARRIVDATDVGAGLADGALLLIDAREPDRFAGRREPVDRRAGHVPGAVNVPFRGNLGAGQRFLPAGELRRVYTELARGHGIENIACMCGSGVTACHTLLAMEVAGMPGAALYVGSWSDWISDPRRPVATE